MIYSDPTIELNKEQQNAIDLVRQGYNVLLTGGAGTGKTLILRTLQEEHPKKNVVILAPTGVAALNIRGQTIHSFFQFPVGVLNRVDHRVYSKQQKVIEAVEIIIIDEISMVRADLFWAIDAILKRFAKGRNKKASMGGRQIIVCGDFLQLPPFAREPEVTEYIKSEFGGLHAFCSGAWNEAKFVYCNLKHVYRQQDHQMQNILNVLRHGQLWPQKDEAPPLSVLNQNCCWSEGIRPHDATCLCTVNRIADAINQARLDDLPGSCMTFKGRISHKFPINELPVEFCLKIKKGARVMLRANSYFERIGGYEFVNGDTGTVEGFDNNIPQMPRVSVRLDNDRVVSVPPNIWKYYQYELEKGENGKHRITQVEAGKFVQLPLSPAWAISIHKSQGLTLPQVHLILGNSGCFCPGQLYTALSRVPSMDRLTIDRPIRKEDVIVDQAALAFYDRLDLGLQ